MTPLCLLMSPEVGNESVNYHSRDLNRGSLAYHMLCTQVYRGLAAAHYECGTPHKTSKLGISKLPVTRSR